MTNHDNEKRLGRGDVQQKAWRTRDAEKRRECEDVQQKAWRTHDAEKRVGREDVQTWQANLVRQLRDKIVTTCRQDKERRVWGLRI